MELVDIFIFLEHVILYIVSPFYNFINRKKRDGSMPPIKNPLLKLSATTLAKKIRERNILSETVVEAYIERIKEVNPILNAVIENRFEAAITEAKEYDAKIKAGGFTSSALEKEKPLYGVPITVKESCCVKGMSYTGCTLQRKGVKAPNDSLVVERLKSAGAIVLCVTNTPEFCSALQTSNYLFGNTANPYDRRKTSGGSSGGEASLLGAGASVIGVGSDLCGSIRVPAHFCGIFGHKPTPGIIPTEGHFPSPDNDEFKKYMVIGPMARYTEDLQLAVKVMSSKCGYDLRLNDSVDVRKIRVYHMDEMSSFCGVRSTTREIKEKIKEAVQYLEETGAEIQEFPKDWLHDAFRTMTAMMFGREGLPNILPNFKDAKKKKNSLIEAIKVIFNKSEHTKTTIFAQMLMDTHALIPKSKLPEYERKAETLRQNIENLLKDDGVFIYPTYPCATVFPELIPLQLGYVIYCMLCNILGFPSTHVTMGLNKDGLPIGYQVIAGPHQDRLCLAVAKEMEKKFGGWVPPMD